uniref:TRA4 protein n=1 Tax=Streptomyces prasinus TaxID=67345 RepID=Q53802_9ACTN|nr:TRA4 [Streptomyces prasinus]
MARPMNQLPQIDDPLVVFARDLQALRKKADDPPLAMMAQHSGMSTATLSNAHAGKKLPTWATVNGYVLACGGNPEDWSARWESLRLGRRRGYRRSVREALRRWERTGNLTPPQVTDEGELRELLKTLLDFNGLSHRTLAQQAPGYSHVTYGAVLRGAGPLRAKILYQILIGCGVYSLRSQEAWFHLLSSFSWKEGVEGGKLLARVEQPFAVRR